MLSSAPTEGQVRGARRLSGQRASCKLIGRRSRICIDRLHLCATDGLGRSYERPPFLILHDKSRARSWQDNLHHSLRRDLGIRNFPVAMELSATGSTRSHEVTLVPLDVLAQRLRVLRSEMPGTDISEPWQTPLTVQCCNWDVFVPGMSAGLDTGLVDALNRIECLKGELPIVDWGKGPAPALTRRRWVARVHRWAAARRQWNVLQNRRYR